MRMENKIFIKVHLFDLVHIFFSFGGSFRFGFCWNRDCLLWSIDDGYAYFHTIFDLIAFCVHSSHSEWNVCVCACDRCEKEQCACYPLTDNNSLGQHPIKTVFFFLGFICMSIRILKMNSILANVPRDHYERFTQSLDCIILKMRENKMRTERTLVMNEIGRRKIHIAATDTSRTNIYLSFGAHSCN